MVQQKIVHVYSKHKHSLTRSPNICAGSFANNFVNPETVEFCLYFANRFFYSSYNMRHVHVFWM